MQQRVRAQREQLREQLRAGSLRRMIKKKKVSVKVGVIDQNESQLLKIFLWPWKQKKITQNFLYIAKDQATT